MKFRYLFLLLTLFINPSRADFSNATAVTHPYYLGTNQPFILDIQGEWPTDCHPGEQKPVIKTYDGEHVEIEFETIVEPLIGDIVPVPPELAELLERPARAISIEPSLAALAKVLA